MPLDNTTMLKPTPPVFMTAKEARRGLAQELIRALQTRPQHFRLGRDTCHLVDDNSGMVWQMGPLRVYLASVRECSCRYLRLSIRESRPVFRAIAAWNKAQPPQPVTTPHAHEAVRLWKCNNKLP